jgi:hypothetical protein
MTNFNDNDFLSIGWCYILQEKAKEIEKEEEKEDVENRI